MKNYLQPKPRWVTWLSIYSSKERKLAISSKAMPQNMVPSKVCLVFVSPVSRPQKDRNQTRPRLEKTGPAVQSFDFWESKTAKRSVFMDRYLWFRPVWTNKFVLLTFPYKMSPRSLKTVKIWLRNKLNHTMLTKIVDFTEYYCRIFNFRPYWAFLSSF